MYVKYLRNSTIYLVIGSPFRVLVVLRRDDPRFHMWVESLTATANFWRVIVRSLDQRSERKTTPKRHSCSHWLWSSWRDIAFLWHVQIQTSASTSITEPCAFLCPRRAPYVRWWARTLYVSGDGCTWQVERNHRYRVDVTNDGRRIQLWAMTTERSSSGPPYDLAY